MNKVNNYIEELTDIINGFVWEKKNNDYFGKEDNEGFILIKENGEIELTRIRYVNKTKLNLIKKIIDLNMEGKNNE